jgi:flagellar biosynthesis chaperone FliJ
LFGKFKNSSLDFSDGRPVNNKELEVLLRLKADKKDAEELLVSKANREELKTADSQIKELRGQLNNALVLFIE